MIPTTPTVSRRRLGLLGLAASALCLPLLGQAHGDAHTHHGANDKRMEMPPEQQAWGVAGRREQVTRTIEIRMGDDMTFRPARLEIKQGQTVRLVAINTGKVMHEIVLGTPAELKAHAQMMKQHPNMEHDEPHMAHVKPGQRGELIWTFNRPGEFEFACLLPGHFEAGMVGKIRVR
jgi:uncharacterized cupredoxin-like copper-binding protein